MLAATSRTRVSTSSSGNSVAGFTFGSSELRSQTAGVTLALLRLSAAARSQVTKETSASGSAAGRRLVVAGDGIGEELLRIERRNIGGEIGHRQRQIAGDADEGAGADQFAIADVRRGRHAQDLARHARLADRRQPIGLAEAAQAIADAGDARRATPTRPAPAPRRNWFRRRVTQKRRRPSEPRRIIRSGSFRRTIVPKAGAGRPGRRCRRRPKAAAHCRDRSPRHQTFALRRAA